DDPEMPINIVDLGLVGKTELTRCGEDAATRVSIEILPTFVGCHALPFIESEIQRKLTALPGVTAVEVQVSYSPPWTVERITPAGRESLRQHGVTVPGFGEEKTQPPTCPYCASITV